jgi:hypothetical protein
MKPQRKLCCVLAVGFIVLFFWCIGLYWGDVICSRVTSAFLPSNFSMQEPKELNVWTPTSHRPGRLSCYFGQYEFFASRQIGIVRFIQTLGQWPATKFSTIPTDTSHWIDFVYDDQTKQVTVRQTENQGDKQTQKIAGYIGPKGYSGTKNPSLGTFEKPLFVYHYTWTSENPDVVSLFLYDAGHSRFYRIEMNVSQKTVGILLYHVQLNTIRVIEGPIQKQPDFAPVQIDSRLCGVSDEGPSQGDLDIMWNPPYKVIRQFRSAYAEQYASVDPNTMPDSEAIRTQNIPLKNSPQMRSLKGDFFVLHQDGRIDYLDGKTLSVVRCAGYLPEIGFYKNSISRRPHDMADYEAFGFYDPNDLYLGTAVAAISRDGVMRAIDFYDAKGNLSASKTPGTIISNQWEDCTSGIQIIKDISDGRLLLTVRYLLENLQPPLLRLLDMPAAEWMEPDERCGTFFVHPNSFIGLMKFEYDRFGFWWQLLFLMLPSLALSIWLGIKARRKAALLGYDTSAKDAWFITILAFGIPAYITFKLMLPKERMVTCANCGNLRRVEFDVCQSCKRDWEKTKTLTTPPDWSVKDLAKTAVGNPPTA